MPHHLLGLLNPDHTCIYYSLINLSLVTLFWVCPLLRPRTMTDIQCASFFLASGLPFLKKHFSPLAFHMKVCRFCSSKYFSGKQNKARRRSQRLELCGDLKALGFGPGGWRTKFVTSWICHHDESLGLSFKYNKSHFCLIFPICLLGRSNDANTSGTAL